MVWSPGRRISQLWGKVLPVALPGSVPGTRASAGRLPAGWSPQVSHPEGQDGFRLARGHRSKQRTLYVWPQGFSDWSRSPSFFRVQGQQEWGEWLYPLTLAMCFHLKKRSLVLGTLGPSGPVTWGCSQPLGSGGSRHLVLWWLFQASEAGDAGQCCQTTPASRGELRRASCGRCRGGGPCTGVVGQGRHQPASCCLFPLLLLNQTQVAGWVPWAFPHLRRCEPSRGLRLSKPVRLAGKVCASQKVGTRDHPNGREL